MRIAFFADDASAGHAALMAADVLDRRADANGPGVVAGSARTAEAVVAHLSAAACTGHHLMVALPLSQLDNLQIRTRVAVAVVTLGHNPMAAARAVRAARDAARGSDAPSPPWLLACGSALPPTDVRTLPVELPWPPRAWSGRTSADRSCRAAGPAAIGLAAALYLAAADPCARGLKPADVLGVLCEPGTAAGLALRRRLLDLAARLDDLPDRGRLQGRPSVGTATRRDPCPARVDVRGWGDARRAVRGSATTTKILVG